MGPTGSQFHISSVATHSGSDISKSTVVEILEQDGIAESVATTLLLWGPAVTSSSLSLIEQIDKMQSYSTMQ